MESARTVARWLDGRGEVWAEDEILLNAVLRQLTVVGEAASCLSPEARDKLPDIPWSKIRGFRNQAVHAYFSIDWSIVREIAAINLPDLQQRAMALLRVEFPEIAEALDHGTGGSPG